LLNQVVKHAQKGRHYKHTISGVSVVGACGWLIYDEVQVSDGKKAKKESAKTEFRTHSG
jgi:hypothetical protein